MLFYIKNRGGDPRNHNWLEVGEHDYNNANKESYFKKEGKTCQTKKQRQGKERRENLMIG